MANIYIKKINEVHSFVTSDRGTEMEMADYFTFEVPGYKFMPAYKNGSWDGTLRLFNVNLKRLYNGLIDQHLVQFAQENDHQLVTEEVAEPEFEIEYIEQWLDKQVIYLKGGDLIDIREYQYSSVVKSIHEKRVTLVAPTSSGKSLIIYLITKFLLEHDKKVLIQVPSLMLVEQMAFDFDDYNNGPIDWLQKISGKYSKDVVKSAVVTTWQSQHSKKKKDLEYQSFINEFDCIIQDEVHLAKSTSIVGILEMATDVPYRIGCTGTLDRAKCNKLVIEGLFGPAHKVITTAQLMDQDQVSQLKVKMIQLEYPKDFSKIYNQKTVSYQDEVKAIVSYEARNRFICNLAKSLKGNVLILTQFVDLHVEPLYEMIQEHKETFMIHGGVDGGEREEIRKSLSTITDAVIVASYQTMSTGVSIPSLEHVILASPTKSMVRLLQSIGRGLRLNADKTECVVYDIADQLKYGKRLNFAMRHAGERIRIYATEQFNYKIINIKVGNHG